MPALQDRIACANLQRTLVAVAAVFGSTLQDSGISKRMSVRFEDGRPDGNFKTRATGKAA